MHTSLYIHIPFCNSLCDYCDFYSITTEKANDKYIELFLGVLIDDIKRQIDFFNISGIRTAYIGGGTPSALGKRAGILFDALNAISCFTPCEFTIEANPESITESFLETCLEGGINRLSLGVQTFHEPSRAAVNRAGAAGLLHKRLALASRFFPDSLSVDLITGLPKGSEKTVQEDIKRLLDFAPAHVSLYSLSVESGVPLEKNLKNKTIELPAEDNADCLWLTGRNVLLKAGFQHYEISNFAVAGKQCIHNMRYWQMDGWLGAGPSASGTIIDEKTGTARRFTCVPDVDAYINTAFNTDCEELDKKDLLRESLLMGFRCKDGPAPEKFHRRFGITLSECIPKTLARWEGKDKMLFLNSFLSEAFLELDRCR